MTNPIETQDGSQPKLITNAAPAPLGESAAAMARDVPTFPVARWNRYAFVRLLGQGGMGTVYEARDPRLNRNVALKFIRGGDPRLTMRLVREARAQARIDHENVCKVFEVGEVEGKAYIAMQHVRGETLDKVANGLSLDEKVIIARDVAHALHAAHALGILHRDVKPANILVEVTADGRNKPILMDFGLARDEGENRGMTDTGAILGTPAYASPEQVRGGRDVDRRSDVYSLGATLYELISGVAPFSGDSPMAIILSVLNDEPVALRNRAPSVPADLATITTKCLHKDPGQRYESARALAEDLDRHIRGEPILGRKEGVFRRFRRWAAKHRTLVVVGFLALVAIGFVGAFAILERMRASREKAALQAEAEVERNLAQDIKEIEWFLRTAYMLPLHDVTPERAWVKDRIKRIEEQKAAGPRVAALVEYAMGRGHLALGEIDEAYRRLSLAQQQGIVSPELHYALGLVQGRRYEMALDRLRGNGDPRWVEQQMKEIEGRYLRPALDSIEKSRGARIESPSYLEALVAFYKKDYSTAIMQAQKARGETQWLYEALALEAESHLSLGNMHKVRGERDLARADLDEAVRLFGLASDIGRSDGSLYEGIAEARIRRMELFVFHGTDMPENDVAITLDSAEKAARARPDRGAPFVKMAFVYAFSSGASGWRGGDHRAALDKAIANLDRAREIDGETFIIHELHSDCLLGAGNYEFSHGLDPRLSLQNAILHANKAIELDPAHPWGWLALGHAQRQTATYMMSTGEDPTGYFLQAIANGVKAAELEGGYGFGWDVAHWSCALRAQWLTSRGKDPKSEIGQECNLFDRCMQANPKGQCQENEAMLHYAIAEYQLLAGQDPGDTIRYTEKNLEIAASILKDFLENRQLFVALRLLQARNAFRRGADVTSALNAFDKSIQDCFQLDANDALCTLFDARRALLDADIEFAARRPEKRALEKVVVIASLAVARNQRDADGFQVLAEAKRRLANSADAPGQTKLIREGVAACEKGLAMNPRHPRLILTCGGLRLLEARGLSVSMRKNALEKIQESFAMAASLNPLLRPEVDTLRAK